MTDGRKKPQTAQLGGLLSHLGRGSILLLLAENPTHGYNLLEPLRALGFSAVDRAALYRTLKTLEREGLVRSRAADSELGPPRRVYEVTEEGEQWLHTWAHFLEEMKWSINSSLKRYQRLFREAEPEPPAAGQST